MRKPTEMVTRTRIAELLGMSLRDANVFLERHHIRPDALVYAGDPGCSFPQGVFTVSTVEHILALHRSAPRKAVPTRVTAVA